MANREIAVELKAFLIHKHELIARKGSLLGKSYCSSWRRLLTHVNYVICSIGWNGVHENVSHGFWLVAWKSCWHKKTINERFTCQAMWHCLLKALQSLSNAQEALSRVCIDFKGPFRQKIIFLIGVNSSRMSQWDFILLRNTHCPGLCSPLWVTCG